MNAILDLLSIVTQVYLQVNVNLTALKASHSQDRVGRTARRVLTYGRNYRDSASEPCVQIQFVVLNHDLSANYEFVSYELFCLTATKLFLSKHFQTALGFALLLLHS